MRRHYTDEQKADALTALDANGGNVKATAERVGIPRTVLQSWKANRGVADNVTKMRHEKRGPLADRLDALAHTLLDDMETERAGRLNEKAVALGIAIDKSRLLRGEATSITETRNVDEVRSLLTKRITRLNATAQA